MTREPKRTLSTVLTLSVALFLGATLPANAAMNNRESIANVVEDATPQLGGDLDVNGNSILSNGDMTFQVDADNNGTQRYWWLDGSGAALASLVEGQGFSIAGNDRITFGGGDYLDVATTGEFLFQAGAAATDQSNLKIDTDGTHPVISSVVDSAIEVAETLIVTGNAVRLPNSTTLPALCSMGDIYFDNDATAGQNVYGCTSTNTWTLQGDGGAVGGMADLIDDTSPQLGGNLDTNGNSISDSSGNLSIPDNLLITGRLAAGNTSVSSVANVHSYDNSINSGSTWYAGNFEIFNAGAGGARGIFAKATRSGTGGSGIIRGIEGQGQFTGSGTQDDAHGVRGVGIMNAAGATLTNAYGVYGKAFVETAGTVTNNYAGYFEGLLAVENGATSSGFLRLYEDSDDGSNYVELGTESLTSDLSLTLNIDPSTCTGDGNGGALTVNGSNQIVCSTDNSGSGGSAITLDIGDDGGNDSTDVTEIATSGDTNSIVTEPSADKILLDMGQNWPSADTASTLAANGSNCTTGQLAAGVDASGAAEGCTDVWTEAENTAAAYLDSADIGVSIQAYDADLTTYAGITPSANVQSLLGAANYAAMRGLLDLEAGTDFYSISAADAAFQSADADLTDLSDGTLTGSKVGTGINAANITTGTLPAARIGSDSISDEKLNVTESKFFRPNAARITGTFALDGDATQGASIDSQDLGWVLLFDDTTDMGATWQWRLPDYWSGHSEINLTYSMASATTNDVEWEGAVMCVSDGDSADLNTASFAAIAVASATVPGTAGYPDEVSITVTDDSCAAGDLFWLYVSTDADDATNDNATGDRELISVEYEYTR